MANKDQTTDKIISSEERATKSNAIEIPSIALPKGGGALKGIDEKFEVNAANGTASLSVPLPLSPGRNGFTPSLSLSYNSGAGNSLFGIGWDLGYPSIQRKTDKQLPRYRDYEDSDTFMFSGVEDLVPVLDPSHNWKTEEFTKGNYTIRRYRPRIEGNFSRIERIQKKGGVAFYWKVTARDNTVTYFGKSPSHRIADPADSSRIFKWLPEMSFDDKGNCMVFEFKEEDLVGVAKDLHEINRHNKITLFTNKHLKKVKYGNINPYYPAYKKVNRQADWTEIYDTKPPTDEFLFHAILDYGEHSQDTPKEDKKWLARPDPFSEYRAGFEIRTYRQCQRVLMFHLFTEDDFWQNSKNNLVNYLVRSMAFVYQRATADPGHLLELSYLTSITQTGHVLEKNGTKHKKSLPLLSFEYQELKWHKNISDITPEYLANAPAGLTSGYQWTDFYGEGISGILTEQGDGWYYKENMGDGEFTIARSVMPKPSFTGLSNGILQLKDLEADGRKFIVVNAPGLQGYFELNDDNEWESFRTFTHTANVDLRDPNTRLIDLNGDGQPDIVTTEENRFSWIPSNGTIGYDSPELAHKPYDEERGAAISFADSVQSIFLADMSGDGLTDIVRIRNGEVCYWPNLGYGRFGAKVNMTNAPWFDKPDQFNPAYLHLADISGTGLSDIIYLGKNQFRAWLNLSGNGWSASTEIDPFPQTALPGQIDIVDFKGNGTSCIVWSSPLPGQAPMRYIDLMGGVKPHIMAQQENGFGKKTKVTYKSSTQFYLDDKKQGKPWITKLPFPVQCVAKVEVEDTVAGLRFANEYSYHHGYYDHAEREFRGFGRVDQTDTENYAPDSANEGKKYWQPPVLTRTWFHTGAFFRKDKILHQFEAEYWYNDPVFSGVKPEHPLPDALVKASSEYAAAYPTSPNMENLLTARDYREAARACKGMTLRQEVFAEDAEHRIEQEKQRGQYNGTEQQFLKFTDDANLLQKTPYSVATHNCYITVLQPRAANRYAVFMPLESEAITYHYERNTADPRIAHTMNLEIDERGNVLRSASIVYGRKKRAISLDPRLRDATKQSGLVNDKQGERHIIITENEFTNNEDKVCNEHVYRLRMPWQTKTWELTGAKNSKADIYTVSEIVKEYTKANAAVRPYESTTTQAKQEKRLIEHIQTLYRKDDLSGPLNPGKHGALGLSWEAYQLAYTPGLLQHIFGAKLPPANYTICLETQGHFEKTDGTNWWISSGKAIYPNTLAQAQQQFFLPDGYEDPFEVQTKVRYDNYYLFVEEAEDALKNITSVEKFDFRTLMPTRMKDINGNETEVVTDALGLVVATAIRGKKLNANDDSESGDHLKNYQVEWTDTEVDTFLADPKAVVNNWLGTATTRLIYDFRRTPVWVATIAREQHVVDVQAGTIVKTQLSFEYTGGLGQILLKKAQAEPGEAWHVNRLANGNCNASKVKTGNKLRWVGNGRTILNNKGNPVKQYEPYFSDTHAYEDEDCVRQFGVTPILHYDPVGRVMRTDMPDGSYTKVEFNPWEQKTFDQNDTIGVRKGNTLTDTCAWYNDRINGAKGPEERAAAQKASVHADTPTLVYLDTLGRPFFSVAHNRWNKPSGNTFAVAEEFYATYVDLDIEGSQRSVTDARGNVVMAWKYDMLGHQVYQNSMDGGERWMLNDCTGKPLYHWDSKKQEFFTHYDALHRPDWQTVKASTKTMMIGKTVYGAAADKKDNLNGQVKEQYDTAGIIRNQEADFKGNMLISSRELVTNFQDLPDWSANPTPHTTGEIFESESAFDALNRPIELTAPQLPGKPKSKIRYGYNEVGLLDTVSAKVHSNNFKTHVKGIQHDAKGQRIRIDYDNQIATVYDYDLSTYRLRTLVTARHADPQIFLDDKTKIKQAAYKSQVLQYLSYFYDPVGNITTILNDAQDSIYFKNKKVDPNNHYEYDALYRLVYAEGRELLGLASKTPTPPNAWNTFHTRQPQPGDGKAMGTYVETYDYDAVGNMLQLKHANRADTSKSWTRQFQYAPSNNQLTGTEIANQTPITRYANPSTLREKFGYDVHGNMLDMKHLSQMEWDKLDRLSHINISGHPDADPSVEAWYQYNASGERVRKTVHKQQGHIEQRLYLGGFELYRIKKGGATLLERESLHLMDDTRRIALIETKTTDAGGYSQEVMNIPLTRYQFGNHLDSSCLELDDSPAAEIISYEEYHPYGTTAYQAMNAGVHAVAKRYRYTGMERDEESGLNYHALRYYPSWLGIWISCDPKGLTDGLNIYSYCGKNPICFNDTSGGAKGLGPLPEGVGFVADYEGWGKLWEDAANEVLEKKFKGGSFSENLRLFKADVEKIATSGKGMGSNREEGTAINVARETYKSVRAKFGDLVSKAGRSLEGIQIHHAIEELAVNPSEALSAENLMFARGQAAVRGTLHNILHRMAELFRAGVANPGVQAMAEAAADKSNLTNVAGSGVSSGLNTMGKAGSGGVRGFITLGTAGMMLGGLLSGRQIVSGGKELAEGKTGEGLVGIAEGSANLFLTLAPHAKGVAAASGTGAGALSFGGGILAAGGIMLGSEEARRSIRGEKTAAVESTEYYADLVNQGEKEGGVAGFLKQVGGYTGGFFSTLVAVGQGYRAEGNRVVWR